MSEPIDCKCVEIMKTDPTRHFRGCPQRRDHPTHEVENRGETLLEQIREVIRTIDHGPDVRDAIKKIFSGEAKVRFSDRKMFSPKDLDRECRKAEMKAFKEAWAIVANVSGGDWSKQSPEWVEAAERWRDEWQKKRA